MVESVLQRRLTLSEMLDLSSFNEVCRSVAELYRIGVKVYEEQGNKLVDVKGGNNEFCSYVFEHPQARARCATTAARVKDGKIDGPEGADSFLGKKDNDVFVVSCFFGCRYLVMPVIFEGDLIGRIVFGPFAPDALTQLSPEIPQQIGKEFDLQRAEELLKHLRHAPEATVARIMNHFRSIVDTLAFAGQKVLLTSELHIAATREAFREIEAKNRELAASNQRLRELDRLKSNFLATVSHELRTPLTSIIGYSEMLVQGMAGRLNAEQDEYVQTIHEKGESLLSLISSMLDVTLIEAGRMRLIFAPCDVGEVVRQAVTTISPLAQNKKLKLEVQIGPGMRRPSIDREKVRQCLVNLLSNAVKFTGQGGRIRVIARPDAPPNVLPSQVAGFSLTVEDSGIGIPRDQFDRIFDTFYQVDQSSTREYGGAGLGLAIVKSFIQAHGGHVRVESEVNRFSRFTLIIPYQAKVPETEITCPF